MYNFAISKQKDPYDFSIGAGIDPPTKATKTLNLTGSLSKPKELSSLKQPLQQQKQNLFDQKNKQIPNAKPQSKISSSKGTQNKFGEEIIPKRFGLRYNPPTLIMEYLISKSGKLYHHKMRLLKLQKDTKAQDALEYLKKKHPTYLSSDQDDQIKQLIERLKKNLDKPSSKNVEEDPYYEWKAKNSAKITNSYNNKQINQQNEFDKYKDDYDEDSYQNDEEDEDDEDYYDQGVDYNNYNLNKLSNEELKKHKDKMDKTFKKNNLKPGDKGFVYDKQENFKPSQNCEWDDDFED